MVHAEVLARIKELKLHAHKILQSSSGGMAQSKQHGFGFDFDQLRNYVYGDDVRRIDWKSSARNPGTLYVRQYFQERNSSYVVCVDMSASTLFSSGSHTKWEMMQQVAGALILAASWYKDRIGLLIFADDVKLYIPPSKSIHHTEYLLTQLFSCQSKDEGTNIASLAEYLVQKISNKIGIFVVSDFIDEVSSATLKRLGANRDLVAVVCSDQHEKSMPSVGYVWMQDLESGAIGLVNTAALATKSDINPLVVRNKQVHDALLSAGIDTAVLNSYQTCMYDLLKFFHKRMLS